MTATWALAWFGLVAGQLHALARHAHASTAAMTSTLGLTRAWSVPASEALAPLLTWSDPQTVYLTYGQSVDPRVRRVCAVRACVVRSHRRARSARRPGAGGCTSRRPR